jgi:18S rRNA (guanine1575-N7)-methyltransferase
VVSLLPFTSRFGSHEFPHAMSRPEVEGPAELYYNETRAAQYTTNSRVMTIQNEMAERALQLLNFPEESGPQLIMDLGCGSGLSGDVLSEAGHAWVGLDIRCVSVVFA